MKLIRGLYVPFMLLALWSLGAMTGSINHYILPPPMDIVATGMQLAQSGVLLKHLSISLYRVIVGFLLTFVVAFPLAVILGTKRNMNDYFDPFLAFIRHIPPIACIPILILWFGIGEPPKISIIILATFFPIFLNTLNGVLGCDEKLLEVGRVFGFNPREQFCRIILPAALPSVIIGMRLGFGYSWRALIGAELIAASSGIGYMIIDAEQISRPDIIIVGLITIGVCGYIIDYVFLKLASWFMPWENRRVDYGGS
ncbi:MAG: ABC-type nitrate/sulfonate/bicarbonate transport system, permease component [Firmicutes bacterium]|nr:ABC-type nitrate/sulfonate/bicarbonate transport system, permease component [Bacillota bacterium]